MSQWYYAVNGAQQGPVSLNQLAGWVRGGQVPADALVWRDGMARWQPANEVAEFKWEPGSDSGTVGNSVPAGADHAIPLAGVAPASLGYESPSQEALVVTQRAVEMLRLTKPWVRLFSVLLFIGLGFLVLGCLIQLVGFLALASSNTRGTGPFAAFGLLGIVLVLAVGALYFIPAMYLGRYASRINDLVRYRRSSDLEAALEAQKSYWKFLGVLTLVAAGLYVLLIVVVIVGFGVMSRK